jgi:hypothetical protein
MERLDKHFRQLTRAAYERHGFAYGEVLSQWDAIVGDKLAQHVRPLRIKWPKQAHSAQKYGGVLVVRAEPGFALELQYETPRLIERLNGYFGYGAISGIKITQGAFGRGSPKERLESPPLPPQESARLEERLAGIADQGLKDALVRLGTGLKSRRLRSGQQD